MAERKDVHIHTKSPEKFLYLQGRVRSFLTFHL